MLEITNLEIDAIFGRETGWWIKVMAGSVRARAPRAGNALDLTLRQATPAQ